MPVVAVNIKSIKAGRNEPSSGSYKINNKANLKSVDEKDLTEIGKKGLSMKFIFNSIYTLNELAHADIEIEGDVIYIGNDCDEILKSWKEEGKIKDDAHIEVINAILRKCVTKALVISEDLQLPPPVGLPFAQKEKQE